MTFRNTFTVNGDTIAYERPSPELLGLEIADGFSRDDYVKQIDLEYTMREERYLKAMEAFNEAARNGRETEAGYGAVLLQTNLDAFATFLKGFTEEATRGRQHVLKEFFRHVFPHYDVVATLTLHHAIEGVSDVRPLGNVAHAIAHAIEDEVNYHLLMQTDRGLGTVAARNMEKKKDTSHKRESLKWAIIRTAGMDWFKLTPEERVQIGNALLEALVQMTGWFKIELRAERKANNSIATRPHLIAQAEMMHWIEESREEMARIMRPAYAPMVVPPARWSPETLTRGAYLSPANRPLSMIKTRNKDYLRTLRTAGMEGVYDALNRIQETPVAINKTILKWLDIFVEQQIPWAMDIKLPAMHKLRIEEHTPPKPVGLADDDYRVKEYQKACREFYIMQARENSKLTSFVNLVEMARKYEDDERFFVPWQGDKRMRVYPVSKLNFQGADFVKALLRFADGKKLGKHGMKWLMIHMANLMGVDKVTFEERVAWVEQHKEQIIALANDPRDCVDFLKTADKPMQAIACATELSEAWSMVLASEYVSHLPIALDGSCSGLQILGAALRCEDTGQHVNLIPSDTVADIYRVVAEQVEEEFKRIVGGCTTSSQAAVKAYSTAKRVFYAECPDGDFKACYELALDRRQKGEAAVVSKVRAAYYNITEAYAWLAFGIDRGTVKRNVMTYCYGSAQFGFQEQCMEDIIKPAFEKYTAKRNRGEDAVWHFAGNGNQAARLMAAHAYPAVKRTVKRAAMAMDWMQKAAKLIASANAPVTWTTPLGFPVLQEYRIERDRQVKCVMLGKRRRLNIKDESLDYDANKAANSIAPNVVHSLDSCHLQMLVNLAFEKHGIKHFALIHDSFGTHAGNTEVFFAVIREAMVLMFSETDVFKELEAEFKMQCHPDKHGDFLELPEYGNLNLELIKESAFAFA
ncbi:DNA-directed RNA polymerase [Vibrio sp. SCSIO 43137]|uniref:DNA-directed RNA polymerase n=1 Tax=Vibrio sp. SCSIO 43137 TaxID=3021011 RepID=UPI00230703CB|nr:DNA-directed RNA polymerase [Vibrio sp. SCSIO 43137]WCE28443.1 hypothetical protein PK654_08645 [Vibrio sp. SCSIO 43137]